MANLKQSYDYVIIGSGFGGSPAALTLAKAGKEVLVVERGRWAVRDESCWDENKLHLTNPPMYQGLTPAFIDQRKGAMQEDWPYDTVGGMSTFYGCAAFRMRTEDFAGAPRPDSAERDESTAWPYDYKALSPFYDEMEKLQGVAGNKGEDMFEPDRKKYPQPSFETLSPPSKRIWNASQKLGLHPFHLPMAMNLDGKHGKGKCTLCSTCDHYLCKLEAKNDLSVTVLPQAIKKGVTVLSETRAINLNVKNGRVESVELVNQLSRERMTIKCKHVIVAAGALGTPHLLLSSGIDEIAAGGKFIGHNLMRHSNGVLAGVFPFPTNRQQIFQKMIGVADFYHGDPSGKGGPAGPWGLIQEVSSIGKGVIKQNAPFGLKNVAALFSDFLINLLCIAEDMPQFDNRVFINSSQKDIFGMPALHVYHRYHKRDIEVRNALYKKAFRILLRSGAFFFYPMPIETFSHALGTCRMGDSPDNSVTDQFGKVWGLKNLYLSDASIMPSGGSVNPSLTIGANALRIADHLARGGK